MAEHVAERGLRGFEVGGRKEEACVFGEGPPVANCFFVEPGGGEVVGALDLGGGAGSDKGGLDVAAASEWVVGDFEGRSRHGWNLLPSGDGTGSFAE